MFTGLVQAVGEIAAIDKKPNGGCVLTIKSPILKNITLGESIAVNGCCLTVAEFKTDEAQFVLLEETLRLTNLGELQLGSLVNLEPSLKPTDRMGGHFVSGHIDSYGLVKHWGLDGADWRLEIELAPALLRYVVKKGCIAIDGMSLTVADVLPNGVRIWIIPHTLEVTNLKLRKVGQRVNIETDLLAKYTEKLLAKS
jgi:riboflavin synthase